MPSCVRMSRRFGGSFSPCQIEALENLNIRLCFSVALALLRGAEEYSFLPCGGIPSGFLSFCFVATVFRNLHEKFSFPSQHSALILRRSGSAQRSGGVLYGEAVLRCGVEEYSFVPWRVCTSVIIASV